MKISPLIGLVLGLSALHATAGGSRDHAADPSLLHEIVVTAAFRETRLADLPGATSVFDETTVRQRSATHLDEILNAAPNVNFAAGASRGRFVQIRGIGERSQFVDPVNPSVGMVVDGIDLSGLGNAGTLVDVHQVELLRGPQGTRFGANALAGMINILGNTPTDTFEAALHSGYGNYDSWRFGGVVSGPVAQNLSARLALEQQKSDGFIDNDHLNLDDTNNRDEFTGRGKLHWQVSDALNIDATAFYVDVENGYDAFSLDNTRHTLSDEPGQDRQETTAFALAADWTASELFDVWASISWSDSHLDYGYDEDWSFVGLCTGAPCEGWEYSSTDTYLRERQANRLELRLTSSDAGRIGGQTRWLLGLYYDQRDEDLVRQFFDFSLSSDAEFVSAYESESVAVYGELSQPLSERLSLSLGGRLERFESDYRDSHGIRAQPDEDLWGGQISLDYRLTDNTLLYSLVSRGYKAGGVNGEALGKAQSGGLAPSMVNFLQARLEFDTETLFNYEFGLKGMYLDDRLELRIAAFFMDRDDIQLKGWYNEGPVFVGYLDNAASGENYGLELESLWRISERWQVFANIGWLDTEIDNFIVNVDDTLVDKSGREQAHAPEYQFNIGALIDLGNRLDLRLEIEGKDAFYFSDSHDQRSDSYELLNASLGYATGPWELRIWGRNLTDQDYATRGFYFGNDPRKFYVNETYIQFGEPRVFGINASYHFQ